MMFKSMLALILNMLVDVKESQKQMKYVHAQHHAQMTAFIDEQEEKLKQIDSGIVSLMVAIELVEGTDASSPVASNSSDTDSTRDADDDDSIIKAPVTPVKTNMKKRSPYSTRGTGGCLHQVARLEGLEALCLGAGTSDGNDDVLRSHEIMSRDQRSRSSAKLASSMMIRYRSLASLPSS